MFNFLMMIIGSVLIGFGMSNWMVGVGVFCLAFGLHMHVNEALTSVYTSIINNFRVVLSEVRR
jgi:hypothetical protein